MGMPRLNFVQKDHMHIRLRPLTKKDAPLMLEWMHDADISRIFAKDMRSITLEQAEAFCVSAADPDISKKETNIHYAIVDDQDQYLGTISLKNISITNKNAELGLVTRKKVHGKNIANQALGLLLRKAFSDFGLHKVYLCVRPDNIQAIKFYKKYGFTHEGTAVDHVCIQGAFHSLLWFCMLAKDFCESQFGLTNE